MTDKNLPTGGSSSVDLKDQSGFSSDVCMADTIAAGGAFRFRKKCGPYNAKPIAVSRLQLFGLLWPSTCCSVESYDQGTSST